MEPVTRLDINENFFKAEERDGFLIPEQMKRAWAAKLQLVSWMGEIFDRHGLKWWADWGSLIGAVRHHGFVPWDDDIDISMPRWDYERAVSLLSLELPQLCEVNRYNDESATSFVYVMNRKSIDYGDKEEEKRITEFFFGCPYRCAIDIFPLDNIPDDGAELEDWKYLGESVYSVAKEYDNHLKTGILEDQLELVEEITGQTFPRGDGCKKALLKLFDQISQLYTGEGSRAVAVYGVWLLNGKKRPLSLYERTVRVPFEMIQIPIPVGYQKILEDSFGNWCVPVRGTATHDYPFYAEDEKNISERHINRIITRAEELRNAGAAEEERAVLTDGVEAFPDSYELNYLLAVNLLSVDAERAYNFLKKSAELCTDTQYKARIESDCELVRITSCLKVYIERGHH